MAVLGWTALSGAQDRPTVLANATLHLPQGLTRTANLLIHQGKIMSISEPGAPLSSGADMIDLRGRHLYPGFIDAYSTSGIKVPELPAATTPPAAPASDTASARMDPANRRGLRSDLQAAQLLSLKDNLTQYYQQGLTAGHLSPGVGAFRGTTAVVSYLDADPSTVVLKAALGADIVFRWSGGASPGAAPGGYPNSLMGIIASMRQTLYDAQREEKIRTSKPDAPADAMLRGLGGLVRREMPAIIGADNDREIYRAMQLADEFKFGLIVQGGRDAYKWSDVLKAQKIPVLLNVSMGTAPNRTPAAGDNTPAPVLEERYQTWLARVTGVQKLQADGVEFAFASEGDALGDFLSNIRILISNGLPEAQAVNALTLAPARILGVADRLGSIEPGKMANLTVLSSNLANPESKVISVVVQGRLIAVNPAGSP